LVVNFFGGGWRWFSEGSYRNFFQLQDLTYFQCT
jgi:hypothetical protein